MRAKNWIEFGQSVAVQIAFVNAFEGSQEVPHIRPDAFNTVAVNFTKAVPVLITGIFVGTMTDAIALKPAITLVFAGIHDGLNPDKTVTMLLQGRAGGIHDNAQTHLSTFASNRTKHRRTVISIGTASALLICPPPRWIVGFEVFLTFFPAF
jgi:hypothetical protein